MYGYFLLLAMGQVPSWLNPLYIAGAQMAQMAVGMGLTAAYAGFLWQGGCDGVQGLLLFGELLLYSSYLYLFIEFVIFRFVYLPRKHKAKHRRTELKRQATGDFTSLSMDEVPPPQLVLRQTSSYSFAFAIHDADEDHHEESDDGILLPLPEHEHAGCDPDEDDEAHFKRIMAGFKKMQ